MPRRPAQPVKPRKYCRTEFHPDAEAYLKDLADDVGEEVGYIIRLCVARALPDVEEDLRSGKHPEDEMKKPSKPLKTTLRKAKPIPDSSRQDPPPIAVFAETGAMPAEPSPPELQPLPESCAPDSPPEPSPPRQEPERQAAPAEPPAGPPTSDQPEVGLTPLSAPLQQKLQRVGKMRRG